MKIYNVALPLVVRVLPFVVLVFLTVAIPIGIVGSGGPLLLLVPMLGIVGWNWWVLTTLAHRVVLHDDGAVEWVALARRIRTLPEDIKEIRPERSGGIGLFIVRHSGGRLRFVNQITGFHEVLVHIKSRNPMLRLKGC